MTNEHDLDARLHAADPMAGVTPDLAAIRARVMAQVPTPIAPSRRRPKTSALLALAASVAILAIAGGVASLNLSPRASVQMLTAADDSVPRQSVDTSTLVETFVSVEASGVSDCASNLVACNDVGYASCVESSTVCNDVVTTSENPAAIEPEPTPLGLVAEGPWPLRGLPYLLVTLSALLLLHSLRAARRRR